MTELERYRRAARNYGAAARRYHFIKRDSILAKRLARNALACLELMRLEISRPRHLTSQTKKETKK